MGLSFLLILSGCAGIKVEDNTVYSVLFSAEPNVYLKIDPEFRYIGPIDHDTVVESANGGKSRYKFNSHVFLKTDGRMVKKGISIEIEKIESYYREDLYGHVPYRLESGDITFSGRTYQYIIALIHPKPDNYITIYISKHGNLTPPVVRYGIYRFKGLR